MALQRLCESDRGVRGECVWLHRCWCHYSGWYSRCLWMKESRRILLHLLSDIFIPCFLLVDGILDTAFMSLVVILYPHFANIDSGFAIRTKYIIIVYGQ